MKKLLHILTLWLMLAALPLQGWAASGMLPFGQGTAAAPAASLAAGAGHDHAAMLAAAQAGGSTDQQHNCHSSAQCGGMADCCVAAALAYGVPRAGAQPVLSMKSHLGEPAPPAPVDLAQPKRPPRSSFA